MAGIVAAVAAGTVVAAGTAVVADIAAVDTVGAGHLGLAGTAGAALLGHPPGEEAGVRWAGRHLELSQLCDGTAITCIKFQFRNFDGIDFYLIS